MLIDKKLKFSDAQIVAASVISTDQLDLVQARDLGLSNLQVLINVDESVAASGAATVQFQLQCDDNSGFASPKTVISSQTFAKSELTAGKQIYLPIPIGLDERFVALYFNVGTGPLTAGKFTSGLVEAPQAYKAYPAAMS